MSKLGIHVSSGDRHGFGDLLKNCADAGSPVPVIFAVGQDVWPDVQKYSPSTQLIYRVQPQTHGQGEKDGPGDAYVGDAKQSAQAWMTKIMPNWALNQANYYAPINEFDPSTLDGFKWLNDFNLECMKIAEAAGYNLALCAFSSGNPKDAETEQHTILFTLEQAWSQLLESMQHAKANDHILLLHEYGFNSPAIHDDQGNLVAPASTLHASAPNLALRYRRTFNYLRQFNADPVLVISEASAGVGGLSIDLDAWIEDVKWYDSELMKDAGVLGCCLYQAGGKENIKDAFSKLTAYISQTPTPAVPPPTLPTTNPASRPETLLIDPMSPIPIPVDEPVTPPAPPLLTDPLEFTVTVVNCRNNPAQHDGVIVTFQFNAAGGNGVYIYTHGGQPLAGPVFDRLATRSGKIIDNFGVISGDGQTTSKKLFFSPKDMDCR